MSRDFPEADWKVFRKLHPIALARFCERILAEVTRLAGDTSTGSHERYLRIFELIKQRNAELAHTFDDMRRSTALGQLLLMRSQGLLTEEEFAGFSRETREIVTKLSGHR